MDEPLAILNVPTLSPKLDATIVMYPVSPAVCKLVEPLFTYKVTRLTTISFEQYTFLLPSRYAYTLYVPLPLALILSVAVFPSLDGVSVYPVPSPSTDQFIFLLPIYSVVASNVCLAVSPVI